jgi:hypothetical protein
VGSFYERNGSFIGSFSEMKVFEDGIIYNFSLNGKPNLFTYIYKNENSPIHFERLKTAKELEKEHIYRFFPTTGESEKVGVYKGKTNDNNLLFNNNNKITELYDVDDEMNPLLFKELENFTIGGRRRKRRKTRRTAKKRKTRRKQLRNLS